MFSRIKKLSQSLNQKFILTMLVFAGPVVLLAFVTISCGSWNKTVTGPTASLTLTTTPQPTGTSTYTTTPTGTVTPVVSCPNPTLVDLGLAGDYRILAETGITDVPSSNVTGNVGNSPGSGSQIGLTCAEISGKIYEVDQAYTGACTIEAPSALGTAITNMTTAFTTANGQAYCFLNLGAGILSGLTLTRGVYNWTSNVTIPTDLHLDALGDPTAVWVMQIAGTLDISSAMTVHLDNGALAQNVFWVVAGSNATIETNANFSGVILSKGYIAVNTGATVHGRLLSQTAATLETSTIAP